MVEHAKESQTREAKPTPENDPHGQEPIDPAHRLAVEAGLADIRAGRVATDAEVEEVFARFGRPAR